MEFLQLPDQTWNEFFDRVNDAIRGKRVEVEVIGLDLGDLIEAEWVALTGISYDSREHRMFVHMEPGEGVVDYQIASPRQVFVELGDGAISQVVVFDADEHRHFVRLRALLDLPESTMPGQSPASESPGL